MNSQEYKTFLIDAVTIKISITEYHHWIVINHSAVSNQSLRLTSYTSLRFPNDSPTCYTSHQTKLFNKFLLNNCPYNESVSVRIFQISGSQNYFIGARKLVLTRVLFIILYLVRINFAYICCWYVKADHNFFSRKYALNFYNLYLWKVPNDNGDIAPQIHFKNRISIYLYAE